MLSPQAKQGKFGLCVFYLQKRLRGLNTAELQRLISSAPCKYKISSGGNGCLCTREKKVKLKVVYIHGSVAYSRRTMVNREEEGHVKIPISS